jgi:hypothetical protein
VNVNVQLDVQNLLSPFVAQDQKAAGEVEKEGAVDENTQVAVASLDAVQLAVK